MTANDRVAVAMLGARMHYAVPRILQQEGLLDRFFTDLYIGNKRLLQGLVRALPAGATPRPIRRLLGRSDDVIPAQKVTSFDGLGLWYAWALARAKGLAEREPIFIRAAQGFASRIAGVGFGQASVLYAFNTAALELFGHAKRRGLYCVLEQTSLPKRLEDVLVREEAARLSGIDHGLELDAPNPLLAIREEREWAASDLVVAASQFVASGLEACGVPAKKIRVIPYGVNDRQFPLWAHDQAARRKERLRVLFVGRVGLRKGIPDLLQAMRLIDVASVELRIAGSIDMRLDSVIVPDNVSFIGPVSRAEIPDLYAWADVLVMPSLMEGSATVTYEALVSGVPVIATPNSGSIVRDGEDGTLVPIRDPHALAHAIERYARDRSLLEAHRRNVERDRMRASLDRYRADLSEFFRSIPEQQSLDPASFAR